MWCETETSHCYHGERFERRFGCMSESWRAQLEMVSTLFFNGGHQSCTVSHNSHENYLDLTMKQDLITDGISRLNPLGDSRIKHCFTQETSRLHVGDHQQWLNGWNKQNKYGY